MKEFVEKLIGRLEEYKTKAYVTGFTNNPYEFGACHGMNSAIEIVNQLAEEYKEKDCSKCSRRSWYQIGYKDAEKKFAEECNNDVCEWSKQGGYNLYLHKTSCGAEDTFDDSYVYCPYCGKKIKVVE